MNRLRDPRLRLRLLLRMPAIAVFWLSAAAAPAHADAAAGRQAYERGDYGEAMAEWQAGADKKDPEAEFGLGSLYEFGAGDLIQDYNRAAYWYGKAARQGNVEAEYRLSLIYAAGGDRFTGDLAEAEKWADLAMHSHGVWGSLAVRFKKLLDVVATPEQQADGDKRASAWTAALTAAKTETAAAAKTETTAAATPAQPPPPAGKSGGCPGWPFPTLPCTEQFPALTGVQPPSHPPPAPPLEAAAPPKPSAAKPPLLALNEALSRFDCAELHGQSAADDAAVITGVVPDAEQKAKLLQLAAQYFPAGRNEITVDIVPPPVCRSLVALGLMKSAGKTGERELGLRLHNGTNRLREGEPIELQVRAPEYPVVVRIDYFSLDGRVLHMKPDSGEPPPTLAAGETHLFGDPANGEDWRAGGAPFGTELIAAVATPVPLDLRNRPRIENAAGYLRDLKRVFDKTGTNSANRGLVATLRVETSGR